MYELIDLNYRISTNVPSVWLSVVFIIFLMICWELVDRIYRSLSSGSSSASLVVDLLRCDSLAKFIKWLNISLPVFLHMSYNCPLRCSKAKGSSNSTISPASNT